MVPRRGVEDKLATGYGQCAESYRAMWAIATTRLWR